MSFLLNPFLLATPFANVVKYNGHFGNSGATVTYTSAPLDTADPSRIILVLLNRTSTLNSSMVSVTCGTIELKPAVCGPLVVGGATSAWVEAWYYLVPTGTSANIVATGNSVSTMDLFVYSIYGCSMDILDLVATTSETDTTVNFVDVAAAASGGVAAIASADTGSITYTEAWDGSETVVEDFDNDNNDNNHQVATAHFDTVSASATNDLTFTLSGSQSHVGIAVSFAPVGTPDGTSNWHALARGDRTSLITITTTATLGGGTINNLIDGGFTSNSTDSCWFNSGQSSVEIKLDFGTGKIVNALRWHQDTINTHGTWAVHGSNDDSTYTKLSIDFNLGGATFVSIRWLNDMAYRYYKLIQSAGTTSSGPWLRELELQVADSGYTPRDTLERDFRLNSIVATTTATLNAAGGPIQNLIDGFINTGISDACVFDNAQSGREIKFDLGVGVTRAIIGLLWFQDILTTHGTWDFKGSNDDSTYTTLDTFTLGGFFCQDRTFANATAYRYYKLLQTSGTTSSACWLMEIEFKI